MDLAGVDKLSTRNVGIACPYSNKDKTVNNYVR